MIEHYRKYNQLANSTANNLQIYNLRNEIAELRVRIEKLERLIKDNE